jgi:hypothetical protein
LSVCSCHGRGDGGLFISGHGSIVNQAGRSGNIAIKPFDIAGSHLIDRLEGRGGPLMPQGGPALPAASIQKIKDWVCNGAKNN